MSEAKQGIVDLLTRIGDPNIVFQNLDHCMRGAQSIKGGATEIRFGTEAVSATELMLGNKERMALILWVKRTDVQSAREAFAAGTAATQVVPHAQKSGTSVPVCADCGQVYGVREGQRIVFEAGRPVPCSACRAGDPSTGSAETNESAQKEQA